MGGRSREKLRKVWRSLEVHVDGSIPPVMVGTAEGQAKEEVSGESKETEEVSGKRGETEGTH